MLKALLFLDQVEDVSREAAGETVDEPAAPVDGARRPVFGVDGAEDEALPVDPVGRVAEVLEVADEQVGMTHIGAFGTSSPHRRRAGGLSRYSPSAFRTACGSGNFSSQPMT